MTRRTVTIHSIILLGEMAILGIGGCASANKNEISDIPVRPASSYQFSENKFGVTVAVDPFIEENRLNTYFGANLLSRGGILPVLVVIDNESARQGFILQKEATKIVIGDNINSNKSYAYEHNAKGGYPVYNSEPNAPDGSLVRMILFGVIGELNYENFMILNPDYSVPKRMQLLEYEDRTVYPGESHQGVIYLKFPNPDDTANIKEIILRGKYLRTNEITEFTIKTKGEAK